MPGELTGIAMEEAPLLIDTAMITEAGLYSLDSAEHSMLVDIAYDSDSLGKALALNSRRTDLGSSDLASDTDVADVTSGEYVGCRDAESLALLHQILPYGSQLRDIRARQGTRGPTQILVKMRRCVKRSHRLRRQYAGTRERIRWCSVPIPTAR